MSAETPTASLARIVQPLEPTKAALVRESFGAMFARIEEWQTEAAPLVVTSEDQTGKMKRAKILRLEIREARVALDKKRKALKEGILLEGRAIDGAFAVFEALATPLESHLREQETFGERAEAGRRDALRDARAEALAGLGFTYPTEGLGALDEEAWGSVLADAKAVKEAREAKAKEEAEVAAEAARLTAERRAKEASDRAKAEAERVAREEATREENERLRAEAAQRDALEAAERAEREAAETIREGEREVERRKHKAEAERLEREAADAAAAKATAEKALADRRAEDERREAGEKARAEAKLAIGDVEHLQIVASAIRSAKLPELKSERGRKIVVGVRLELEKVAAKVEATARKLADVLAKEGAI